MICATAGGHTPGSRSGWGLVLAGFSVTAWLAVTFGAKLGLASPMERAYAATTTFAAGAWLTVATGNVGPFTFSPLPASTHHRRGNPLRPLVGAPTPAREGSRGTQTRRMAGHRASNRPYRL